MKRNVVFVYRVSTDSGFAPCVTDELLTLACCKGGWKNGKETGIRFWIGNGKYKRIEFDYHKDTVYIAGIYREKLLYFAQVDDAPEMKEYFRKHTDRQDCIYSVDANGDLFRNVTTPQIHPKSDLDQIKRDICGRFVLCSWKGHFTYFGRKIIDIKNDCINLIPRSRETKVYMDTEADKLVCWFKGLESNGLSGKLGDPNDKASCNCR